MEFCFTGTSGAICNRDNSNVSFFIRDGEILLLIDCPGDLALKAERIGLNLLDLDLLVLTHSHPDHLYGLPQLIQHFLLLNRKKKLLIASNSATNEKAKSLLNLYNLDKTILSFPIEWIISEKGKIFKKNDLTIELTPVRHSVPTSGVVIKNAHKQIIYSSDTGPDALAEYSCLKPDVLIHEASGLSDIEEDLNRKAHSSSRQAAVSAVQIRAEILYLCHFSDSSQSHLNRVKEEAESVFMGDVVIPEIFRFYRL